MNPKKIKIESSWKAALSEEFAKPYFIELFYELHIEEENENIIYPPHDKIFHAFDRTPLDDVKAVIIGQDPYHQAGQANGLAFSVSKGQALPPSLKNIFKEFYS